MKIWLFFYTRNSIPILYCFKSFHFRRLFLRLYLDQGFDEGKENENGKVKRSNCSGPLDPLTFPFSFPFPSTNP